MNEGIIVGADQKQEWLIPWWWKHYSKSNSLPVTFIDFGMSEKSLAWCKKHGKTVRLSLDQDFIAKKSEVEPALAQKWEAWNGKAVWEWRAACFNKPFALHLAPYEKTVWIDLDCEILAPIAPIFTLLEGDIELAVADSEQRSFYNSGVIVFRKNAAFIKKWADLCVAQNTQFCTDDFALTHLLAAEAIPFQELPREWNWLMKSGVNPFAKILHWSSEEGKRFIKIHGGLE